MKRRRLQTDCWSLTIKNKNPECIQIIKQKKPVEDFCFTNDYQTFLNTFSPLWLINVVINCLSSRVLKLFPPSLMLQLTSKTVSSHCGSADLSTNLVVMWLYCTSHDVPSPSPNCPIEQKLIQNHLLAFCVIDGSNCCYFPSDVSFREAAAAAAVVVMLSLSTILRFRN